LISTENPNYLSPLTIIGFVILSVMLSAKGWFFVKEGFNEIRIFKNIQIKKGDRKLILSPFLKCRFKI
jgi:hypothetical protein